MIRRAMLVLTTMAIALLLASGATLAGAGTKTNEPNDNKAQDKSQDTKIQSQSASESTSERVSNESANVQANGPAPPPTSTENGFTLTKILGSLPILPIPKILPILPI